MHLPQLLLCSLLGGIAHPVEILDALRHLATQTLQVSQTLLLVDSGSKGLGLSGIDERRNRILDYAMYCIKILADINMTETKQEVVVFHHDVIGGVHQEQRRILTGKLVEERKRLAVYTVASEIQMV